ncbi:MAG TPA: tungsten ABC transporter substrate-binding protein, partial [Chloroflexia bacterium]|nr:tungsten ABC transporter substrate-binding protein [Chloroflexia bacterium]
MRLATTEALQAGGLLAGIGDNFAQHTGYRLVPLVGSVADIQVLADRGQADLLLMDAPSAQAVLHAGPGREGEAVLSTDVVLLGPAADPANLAGRPVLDALRAIAATGATFVSRRDGLDANRFELALWQSAMGRDVQHEGWYVSTHQGGA